MAQPSTQACRPLNLLICSLYLPALSARSSSLPQTTGFLCAHLSDKPSVGEGVCVCHWSLVLQQEVLFVMGWTCSD